MKMSLTEINTLMVQGNTIVSELPTSEGQVSRVIFGKNFQGLRIPVLRKAPYMGPASIMCGTKLYFVVKTSDKSYEIHKSKTAYMRFQKQK
jgi:hypothetical protein